VSRGADGLGSGAAGAGRVVGVDLGSRRVGVAVSDDHRRVASGLAVLPRSASHAEDHRGLGRVVVETGANLVVVGLPLSLTGAQGLAAADVQAEVAELRMVLDVPVELCDERYTTVIAHQALSAGGRRPAVRRALVDKIAAAAILQTWLDRHRARPQAWPDPGDAGAGGRGLGPRRSSRRAR
jgi:putative Holliday junction resolvase